MILVPTNVLYLLNMSENKLNMSENKSHSFALAHKIEMYI